MTHAVDVAAFLKHAATASDGGDAPSGKKKGGGKFDESKVKRDGDGQFARKQGKKELTWAEANKLDLEWNKNFEAFVEEFQNKLSPKLEKMMDTIAKKNGFNDAGDLAFTKEKKVVEKVISEYMPAAIKMANEALKAEPSAVSPSGRQKIESYRTPEGNSELRIVGTVKNDTNPTPPSLPKKRRGPMFNPTVDISGGKVTDELKQSDDSDALVHAERTIQDIMNEMSEDEKDFQALLVGAGIDDEDISDPAIIARYDALSQEHKNLVHFLVGNIVAEYSMTHSDTGEIVSLTYSDGGELYHFGVKGMKWGVIRDKVSSPDSLSRTTSSAARTSARASVKSGGATLGEAHVAALKSNGHRAINAFTGDKTFWKRTAIAAGVAAGGLALAGASPVLLPSSVLAGMGEVTATLFGLPTIGGLVGYSSAGSAGMMTTVALGEAAAKMLILTSAWTGAAAAEAVNVVGNTARAIGGNARINKSYANLGKSMQDRQNEGTKRVRKMLNKSGSIAKKDLKQSDTLTAGVFLSHMMEAIEAFEADDELMHFGIKGMKWGIRRSDVQLALLNRRQAKLDTAQVKLNAKAQTAGLKKVTVDQEGNIVSKGSSSTSKAKDDDIEISEDALKLVQLTQKPTSALSNKEIQDALNRANIVKQYDQIFNPTNDPNAELQRKVTQLNLQKQYSQLVKEMTPLTGRQRFTKNVTALVKGSSKTYKEYLALDKATGGAMSQAMGEAFRSKGNQVAGKRRGPGAVLRPPSTTAAMKKAAEKAAKKAKKNP